MNINHLRYILILYEEQHFGRSARRCHVSQPSLTNAVRSLEDELGGALFLRKPRPQLTALGRALRPYFARIVDAADKSAEVAVRMIRQHPDLSLALARENGAGRTRHEQRMEHFPAKWEPVRRRKCDQINKLNGVPIRSSRNAV